MILSLDFTCRNQLQQNLHVCQFQQACLSSNLLSMIETHFHFTLYFFLCIRNQFGNIYIQKGATSVRERMDHLYNNPDMSDLTISAEDRAWCWGQTSQEFIVSIAEMETGLV